MKRKILTGFLSLLCLVNCFSLKTFAYGRDWTIEEDNILIDIIPRYILSEQNICWDNVLKNIKNCTKSQCIYRWSVLKNNVMNFSEDEDDIILSQVIKGCSDWSEVAENLRYKSAYMCEYRFPYIVEALQFSEDEKIGLAQGVIVYGENWTKIAHEVVGEKTPGQCKYVWDSCVSQLVQNFSKEEDDVLRNAVWEYGEDNWEEVSYKLPYKHPKDCKNRWECYLKEQSQFSGFEDIALKKRYQHLHLTEKLIGMLFRVQ